MSVRVGAEEVLASSQRRVVERVARAAGAATVTAFAAPADDKDEDDDALLQSFPSVADGDEYARFVKHSEKHFNHVRLVPARVVASAIVLTSVWSVSTAFSPNNLLAAGEIAFCVG